MKIVFVASEAVPFAKSGGLADVVGSLPRTLFGIGHDVSLILPMHKVIKEAHPALDTIKAVRIPVHERQEYAGFQHLVHEGMNVFLIDNDYYFGYREHLYGDFDDGERYGFFAHAALKLIDELDIGVDVLHLHDWPTGLIPYILNHTDDYRHIASRARTLFTIHNIAYQGHFDKGLMSHLNIPYDDALDFDGHINFLKTALVSADLLSTVSETHAEELRYAYFAHGLEAIIDSRKDDLFGILNGLDTDAFDPRHDSHIAKPFGLHNYLKGKAANRQALKERFHLPPDERPVLGIVSRLTEQKGFNLLDGVVERHLEAGDFDLVVLGEGDEDIKAYLENLNRRFPDRVGLYFGFSDPIARQIYAGSDFFLMPSRYEPCGLSQMIAMRYGAVPIVRQTGGLNDSVEPFNRYTGEGEGFGFLNFDSADLARAIEEATTVRRDFERFKKLMRRGMQKDFSWERRAEQYETLYRRLRRR